MDLSTLKFQRRKAKSILKKHKGQSRPGTAEVSIEKCCSLLRPLMVRIEFIFVGHHSSDSRR